MKPSDLKVYADQLYELGFDELGDFLVERAEVICESSPSGRYSDQVTIHSYRLVGGPRHGQLAPHHRDFDGHPLPHIDIPHLDGPVWATVAGTREYETHRYSLHSIRTGAQIITYYLHQSHDPQDVLYDLLAFERAGQYDRYRYETR